MSTNEKNAKLGQKESCGGHVTHFWNSGTPNISGINEAKNIKFGSEMDGSEHQGKKCKIASKEIMCGSRDPLLEFFANP